MILASFRSWRISMTEETVLEHVMRSGESQITLDRAVSSLAEYLYTRFYQFKLNCPDEDLRSDYLVWLYPRLAGIIHKFNPEKASLRTYLNWVIKLSYRTFMRNRYSQEARVRACESEETTRILSIEAEQALEENWNCLVSENPDRYGQDQCYERTAAGQATPDGLSPGKKPLSEKKREIRARKLLLLACKAGNFIDDLQIEKVARLSGYDVDYLREKIERIRKTGEKNRERANRNIERQNSYYIRARKCLVEMKYVDRESPRREALEKEYTYCRKRWTDLRSGRRTRIKSPSNRFLAGTLGISRGTIDSTLAQAMKDG